MVPVSRTDGRIIICAGFCNLNKMCPKDDFTLPNIDIFIENTIRYEMVSIMDDFFWI